MKKFFKGLSIICLMLVMLCPLALVGCDKHYTINVKVVAGKGSVYLKDIEGINVVRKNTVDEGDKFEFYVVPQVGYRIDKVVIDGKEQTDFANTGAYFDFDNIKDDHKVEVSFIKTTNVVTFYCESSTSGLEGAFEVFKQVEVNNDGSINLNQVIYGGEANKIWYRKVGAQNKYLYNNSTNINDPIPEGGLEGFESNILYVRTSDIDIYCDYTASELLALGITR